MKNREINTLRTGIISDMLQIAFIVLKLCKVIDWSWWWVFAPCWIPIVLSTILILLKAIVSRWG